MPINMPGPYEIEYVLNGWLIPTRSHVFRVNCIALSNPPAGTLPTAIDMQKMGGGTAKLNVVANQLWEFIRLFYASTIIASGYTLWKYQTGTYAKNFIAAGALTNPACSGGSGTNAHEIIQTYRSANGGIMKLVLLESNQVGDTQAALVPNAAGTPSQKLAAYVMSADNICLARDDAFPVAALRDSRGQNEAVWRAINR